MGWPGACRPALHFPEGPISWPGKGYQCQEGKLECQTNRAGGWRECTPSPGPCSAWKQPLMGASLPFPLSLPFSSAHAQKSSVAQVAPSSSPSPHCLSPRQAWDSQNSLAGVTRLTRLRHMAWHSQHLVLWSWEILSMSRSEGMTTLVAVSGVTARVCAYVSLYPITSECVLTASVLVPAVSACVSP